MNKILLVVTGVLITFCSLCAMPAPKPKARIIAPDTVIQCRPFNVIYQIESRQRPEIPAVADCRASKREGKVTVKGNVRTWTYEVTMETWGSDHLMITCPGAETVCVAVKEHDVYGKELTAARDLRTVLSSCGGLHPSTACIFSTTRIRVISLPWPTGGMPACSIVP